MKGSATADEGVGTVTVMNLGMYRVKDGALIIREPQVLALGTAETRVVPREVDMDDVEDGGRTMRLRLCSRKCSVATTGSWTGWLGRSG